MILGGSYPELAVAKGRVPPKCPSPHISGLIATDRGKISAVSPNCVGEIFNPELIEKKNPQIGKVDRPSQNAGTRQRSKNIRLAICEPLAQQLAQDHNGADADHDNRKQRKA